MKIYVRTFADEKINRNWIVIYFCKKHPKNFLVLECFSQIPRLRSLNPELAAICRDAIRGLKGLHPPTLTKSLIKLNCNYILFTKLPWPGDSEGYFRSSSLAATYPPVYQRWSRGHKARGQGHKKNPRPRPRTAFSRTDPLEAKDRNAPGQGPRTLPQVFSKKKKKKVFKNFFQAISNL